MCMCVCRVSLYIVVPPGEQKVSVRDKVSEMWGLCPAKYKYTYTHSDTRTGEL